MIHGSTKALHTKSLYKAHSTRITRILGLPNEAGETLTGTQNMDTSCIPCRNPVNQQFQQGITGSISDGFRSISTYWLQGFYGAAPAPRNTVWWFERICGMEEHNNV